MLIMEQLKMVSKMNRRVCNKTNCSFKDDFSSIVMPRSGAIQGVVNLDFPGTQDYETLGFFYGKPFLFIF